MKAAVHYQTSQSSSGFGDDSSTSAIVRAITGHLDVHSTLHHALRLATSGGRRARSLNTDG